MLLSGGGGVHMETVLNASILSPDQEYDGRNKSCIPWRGKIVKLDWHCNTKWRFWKGTNLSAQRFIWTRIRIYADLCIITNSVFILCIFLFFFSSCHLIPCIFICLFRVVFFRYNSSCCLSFLFFLHFLFISFLLSIPLFVVFFWSCSFCSLSFLYFSLLFLLFRPLYLFS